MIKSGQCRPIGVFDSGIGGLSVVRAIWAELPSEDIIYVADSVNCPYGPRSQEEIERLCFGITRFLLAQGAKAIVVACNTASAAALLPLRAQFPDVPFIGMVPAVKPAAAWSRQHVVGVLATPITYNGALYHDVVRDHADGVEVLSVVCPGLVELAERGEVDSPRVRQVLLGCLTPMLDSHADALVLGCTHYPFFRPAIEALVGERMRVFDTGEPVARQTRHVLESGGLLAPESRRGKSVFYSTSSAASLREVGSKLLCVDLDAYDARWSNSDLHPLAPDAPK